MSENTAPPNKPLTQAERQRSIEDAAHSLAMEDLTATPATRADAAEYVRGAIDGDELIARVIAKYRVG